MSILHAIALVLASAQVEDSSARLAALNRPLAELPRAPEGTWTARFERPEFWPAGLAPQYSALLTADLVEHDLALAWMRALALLDAAPDFPPALFELGVLAFRMQRYGDAVVALSRFLAVAPAEIGRTRALAHALYSLGRYDEALAHYDAVLGARPEDLDAVLGRALTEWRRGDVDAAVAALAELARRPGAPADALYWWTRIELDEDRGATDELLERARRAAAHAPFDPRAAHLLAELAELTVAPEAQAARARARLLGAADARRRALVARLWLTPQHPPTLAELAALELSIGDVAAAQAWQQRARAK